MKTFLPALLLLLAGAAVAAVAHAAIRRRRDGADCGDYWTRVVLLAIVVLAPVTVASSWLELLRPSWWHSGRHLYLDLTGAFGWPISTCYLVALAVPFLAWLVILGATFSKQPGDGGRWLAGGVGFTGSRHWVMLPALPALAALLAALPRLGGGPGAFPGAAWSLLAVVCLSLAGVARSAAKGAQDVDTEAQGAEEVPELRPWPEAVRDGGLRLRPLASLPASAQEHPVRGAAARDLAERLRVMGARRVAPELVEAVDELLGHRAGEPPARLVLAPDGCGQIEVTALAAHLVDRRCHAHTLVVTPGDAGRLAERFERWLWFRKGAAGAAVAVGPATEVPPRELVWVTDAGTLSDHLLAQLEDPRRMERVGLVVWWDVHDYSGVVAANLWAISRRLHRLLRAHGRPDVRTLALARNASHDDAQVTRFLRRLLPLPADTPEVRVPVRCAKPVEIHLVESHHGLLTSADPPIEPRFQHLPLAAARLSAEKGWDTCLDVPAELGAEARGFLEALRGTELEPRLLPDAVAASVHLRKVLDGDVLALGELFGQGGRANGQANGHAHYVGLVGPDNPYAAYLLERLGGNGATASPGLASPGTSRRLISAEAQDRVIRRHLSLALSELPDTRGELLKSFLHNEEVLGSTLEEIAREGHLTRREVRHLDPRGRLVIDHQYRSRRLAEKTWRPLDTVGTDLVEVRDPTGDGDGVCLRLDRERLTVLAYPQRVFLHGGRRYRVREWTSVDEVLGRGFVACERHDVYSRTWRMRQSGVYDVEPTGGEVTVGGRGKSFTRCAARVSYEEEVTGVVVVTPSPTSTSWPRAESQTYAPIRASFATRALLLGLPFRPGRTATEETLRLGAVSLCQALRHVLPVHLGVSEDDLELVPLQGWETPDGLFGLAVVDLYPGGVGLVDGLSDDELLKRILGSTREWLASCGCRRARRCCLATPGAKAAAMDHEPHHEAAEALLAQVI